MEKAPPDPRFAVFAAEILNEGDGRRSADPRQGQPPLTLYRRIYEWFRAGILDGSLPAGSRLPPTRGLAAQLGVSRNTIVNAFEQLVAEGFIEARTGAGTFVADLPAAPGARPGAPRGRGRETPAPPAPSPPGRGPLSRRGTLLAGTPVSRRRHFDSATPVPFGPGVPGLDHFPYHEFARLTARVYREMRTQPADLGYGAAAGLRELREAIAAHVRIARGVRCEADQIVVVNGSQEGLDLCARLLLDPGDVAYVEEPGYPGARGALLASGARVVPVPLDDEGLQVAALEKLWRKRGRRRALIYVTPSHQFPLGMTMSLSRRLQLLEFARQTDSIIIEDDYDSEFRYAGRPVSALQGLDESGERVAYVGTFSKVLAPALRLGYLVLPVGLVSAGVAARALLNRQPPAIVQRAVARFMQSGGFFRHLRRMREVYRERRSLMLGELERLAPHGLRPLPSDTGLHVTAVFEKRDCELLRGKTRSGVESRAYDQALGDLAAQKGLDLAPLSGYYLRPGPAALQGFLFGFAGYSESEMRQAFCRLAALFF